ncbi:uncharacterized protein LOC132304004 isoform X2 [Cornus florida]|uniref:uncharacterized protein LOC132304004 isoform X2 n=1 Tax=Cornus florida TaxID=4283 RepID=UPI002899779F|nr:uncharacterized protein LOC132304004 isoform X2 [Cornus florida]
MSFVRHYDTYVKLKERQSQEDEDGERDEDPAIRLYKDTHFKEQGGLAHEKAKRNFCGQTHPSILKISISIRCNERKGCTKFSKF